MSMYKILIKVLIKVSSKEGHQSLSSHQVIREPFRQICKVSTKNLPCLNETSCNLTEVSSFQNGNLILLDVFSRLALSFEHQLNKTISHQYNTTTEYDIYSFVPQFLDILCSLFVFSTKELLDITDVIRASLSEVFLSFISHNAGFSGPTIINLVINEHRLGEITNLTSLHVNKDERYDLNVLLIIVSIHSGATHSKNKELMAALNETSKGIISMISVKSGEFKDAPLLLNILGSIYRGLGYPYRSKDLHEFALKLCPQSQSTILHKNVSKSNEKGDNAINSKDLMLNKASTLHKLGIIYRYLSNLPISQVYHEKSLSLLQALFGKDHPYVAGALLNLAVVYSRQGKYHNALKFYNRSLAILKKTFGPRCAAVGRVLNTIGTVYYKLRDFFTAIHYSELGLEILKDFHGMYHPHVAEALNFLGFMYRDQGNLKKAQELLERSLAIKENLFDVDHFIIAEALNDLGVVYTRIGEAFKAVKLLQRALVIFKNTWGEEHSAVTTTLGSLDAACCVLGQPREKYFCSRYYMKCKYCWCTHIEHTMTSQMIQTCLETTRCARDST